MAIERHEPPATPPRAAVHARPDGVRPTSQDAPPFARRGGRPAGVRRGGDRADGPARGARRRRVVPAHRCGGRRIPRVIVGAPAKLTRHPAGHRGAGRRLSPDRRRDGDARPSPTRSTIDPDVATGSTLTVSGPFAAGVPADGSNLVVRPSRRRRGPRRSASTSRSRNGGGLGGGSSDAAAVLRWAGVTDLELAARLGADVPFCLVGGRARVDGDRRGRWSRSRRSALTFTLVVPPFGVSTPAVYAAWDAPRWARPPTARTTSNRPRSRVEPRLAGWRERIGELAGGHAGAGRQRCDVVRRGRTRQRPRSVAERGRNRVGDWNGGGRHRLTPATLSATCAAGDACGGASSCASSSACACGAS